MFAKIDTANLAHFDQWGAIRERKTDVRPVVVLANQRDKSAHVPQFPFNVAYEAFEQGLQGSSHWFVVGYSFRDMCVNDMLRKEFSNMTDKPAVLVVTYGDQPSNREVERALGWGAEDGDSSAWLTINRDGAQPHEGLHGLAELYTCIDASSAVETRPVVSKRQRPALHRGAFSHPGTVLWAGYAYSTLFQVLRLWPPCYLDFAVRCENNLP